MVAIRNILLGNKLDCFKFIIKEKDKILKVYSEKSKMNLKTAEYKKNEFLKK